MSSTSKSPEVLAKQAYEAMKRVKANKKAPLRVTRYAGLINDLLQRKEPRRDFMGDFAGVLAGFRECEVSKAQVNDVRDSVLAMFEEYWPEDKTPVVCPRIAHISEETAELSREAAELLLVHYPSPHHAIAYLSEDRNYEEKKKPLRKFAERVLTGGTAA
jgi:hypothetical protein